ncbi:BTB/POZ domain-containing protein 6 [Sarcoptes scabiei]|uniref:BTB/POZ domain-containing protein 6 n=1 Tax=Sarcoptes scabiei TaxID=52283 RepID=A0A834R788_SARSC|nr:BTB/POZ domain-containing protein 6 [Sarcoptes scabiei]
MQINGDADRLVSRASNLLHNKAFTDVTFIVGPPNHSKKYVGHRVLLAMTSPVFEAMFYGDMADKSKVIRIPDIAPIGFENLLRYAYTDLLNLNSVDDAMLTAYAAKKYLLPHLLRECLNYIEKNITPSSACAVYEFAIALNSQQLIYQAINTIDRQTYHVITHKSFNNIQLSTLEFILNRRYLNLYSEFSLLNAVVQWTQHECKRLGKQVNDWNVVRNILNESVVLKSIRFLTMTAEEFARVVSQTTTISSPIDENGQIVADGPTKSDSNTNLNKESFANVPSFLTKNEQIAIFMNLAIPGIIPIPKCLSQETTPRCAPPEYFTVRRYKPVTYATTTTLAHVTSSVGPSGNKPVKSVSSKFVVNNSDLFIVGASMPIRLDPGFYSVRTPKLDCQLKFTTKLNLPEGQTGRPGDEHQIILDTIDESLSFIISKDKDCHVKLKKPLHVNKSNLNELLLTFQSTSLTDDVVVIKGHRNKSPQMEIVDGEAISWTFLKTNSIEFNELYYYY